MAHLLQEIEGGKTARTKESQLIAQYQYEINELKGKVKFLINKIEHHNE